MDIRIMGSVELFDGVKAVTLPRSGERCVLATLALNPGRRIATDTLVAHVWGDDPPDNAGDTITSYVRSVRRTVEQAGGERGWLSNLRPRGYRLDVDAQVVDYHRFRTLVATARTARQADAIRAYEEAVLLRRGVALADVSGQWAQHRGYAIEQEYLDALCALYERQLESGRFAAVATNATHLIADVIPTDRMILLGAYGLAGSGQHAVIEDFVAHASRRMWETAAARPGAEVLAIARDLVAKPRARLTVPRFASPDPVPPDADDEPEERPVRGQTPAATVTMNATHNARVYQAGGDQYIVGG